MVSHRLIFSKSGTNNLVAAVIFVYNFCTENLRKQDGTTTITTVNFAVVQKLVKKTMHQQEAHVVHSHILNY